MQKRELEKGEGERPGNKKRERESQSTGEEAEEVSGPVHTRTEIWRPWLSWLLLYCCEDTLSEVTYGEST